MIVKKIEELADVQFTEVANVSGWKILSFETKNGTFYCIWRKNWFKYYPVKIIDKSWMPCVKSNEITVVAGLDSAIDLIQRVLYKPIVFFK